MKKVIEIIMNLVVTYLPVFLMLVLFISLTLGGGLSALFEVIAKYNLG